MLGTMLQALYMVVFLSQEYSKESKLYLILPMKKLKLRDLEVTKLGSEKNPNLDLDLLGSKTHILPNITRAFLKL